MPTRTTTAARIHPTQKPPYIYSFANIAELTAMINRIELTELISAAVLNDQKFTGYKFLGIRDISEMIETGDPAIFEQYLKRNREQYRTPYTSSTTVTYFPSDEGEIMNIPAYINDQPEQWYKCEQTPGQGEVKKIVVNISSPWNLAECKYFEKLAGLIDLIDQLESHGTSTEIHAITNSVSEINRPFIFSILIKKAGEPINIQQLCTLVGTAFLQRVIITLLRINEGIKKYWKYHQGNETEILNNPDHIYIPSFYYDSNNCINTRAGLTKAYPHLRHLQEPEPA